MSNVYLDIITTFLGCLLIILVAWYVLYSFSHMKALKALGYNKAWLAWFPPLGLYWALADVALDLDGEYDMEICSFCIPGLVFKLWWLIAIAVSFIPVAGTILNIVLIVICSGTCYRKIYAKLDGKDESEVRVLGYLSGLFPIIAAFKFLTGKYSA
ncbi:MAG: hypothetical protein K2P35_11865 [Lachnospiraceae bacterium]|nr:hypothetical protein [Lachnospiraceae bacterium]